MESSRVVTITAYLKIVLVAIYLICAHHSFYMRVDWFFFSSFIYKKLALSAAFMFDYIIDWLDLFRVLVSGHPL